MSLYLRDPEALGGRGALSASQYARLLDAMARTVAEKSYARTTVADVHGRAGVSRKTFYERFADKSDCFLTAYQVAADLVVAHVVQAVTASPSATWRERLQVSLEAYTQALASDPAVARVLLVDVLGAGAEAVERRRHVLDQFSAMHLALRGRERPLDVEARLHARALVGGVDELVQDQIHRHGAEAVPALLPVLVRLCETVMAPHLD